MSLTPLQLQGLQGRAVQGHNGKAVYMLDGGAKRAIPNMDTFQALRFAPPDIWVLTDYQIAR